MFTFSMKVENILTQLLYILNSKFHYISFFLQGTVVVDGQEVEIKKVTVKPDGGMMMRGGGMGRGGMRGGRGGGWMGGYGGGGGGDWGYGGGWGAEAYG